MLFAELTPIIGVNRQIVTIVVLQRSHLFQG